MKICRIIKESWDGLSWVMAFGVGIILAVSGVIEFFKQNYGFTAYFEFLAAAITWQCKRSLYYHLFEKEWDESTKP